MGMSDLKALVEGYVDGGNREEIEEYLDRRGIRSLMEIDHTIPGLGNLLGFKGRDQRRWKILRAEVYRMGFLKGLPLGEIVEHVVTKGRKGINPYLDPEIVGEDADKNRQLVLDSTEFGMAICRKYGSLNRVGTDCRVAGFLNVDWQKPIVLRRALFELDLLTEVDVGEFIATLNRKGPINSYLRKDVVGDMVEHYRAAIIRSIEFEEWVEDRFDSLYDITENIPQRIYVLFGTTRSRRTELKRAFFDWGFFVEVPVERIVDTMSHRGHISPYLDPEIVGDKVDEHREVILTSDYFREYLHRNFPTYTDVHRTGSIATLLDVPIKSRAFRLELQRRGFYE